MLKTLLSDLTVPELRELLAFLSGESGKASRRKDELIDDILAAADEETVENAAQRLEALSPFKYSWIFSLGALPLKKQPVEDLAQWEQQLWPKSRTLQELDPSSDELQPTLQISDQDTGRLYLKFTHWVQSDRWEQVDATHKELKSTRVRHPIVVVLVPKLGIVEVRFSGYTQGAATPQLQKRSYQDIAGSAVDLLSQRLERPLPGLPLSRAVDDLIEDRPEEVKDVKRVVSPLSGGKLVIDAGESPTPVDVSAFLADFLESPADVHKILSEQVRAALRDTPSDSVLLLWKTPAVLTRVTFHPTAPEIYFLWRGGDKSLETVEYVIRELVDHYTYSGDSQLARALAHVLDLPAGSTIRTSELIQRFHLDVNGALSVLNEGRAKGRLALRFRVKSDKRFESYENSWVDSLADIPRELRDEDGDVVGIEEPDRIEMAFVRTGVAS